MIYRDVEQGTDEWKLLRLSKVTASRIPDVIGKTKTGYGAGRAKYMGQLIAERLTGVVSDGYTNAAMQWGVETEAQAAGTYAFLNDCEMEKIAFADHPKIKMAGASPDRLIGDDGLLEIKCPETHTHIDYLMSQKVPKKYIDQMQWQMACLERDWCDFMSYDPRLPPELSSWIVRVKADKEYIAELEGEVQKFIDEMESKINKLHTIAEAA